MAEMIQRPLIIHRSSFVVQCLGLLLLPLVAGCAATGQSSGSLGRWEGPAEPARVTTAPWTWVEQPARVLRTANYSIYTTIDDPEVLDYLSQIMQGALAMYQQIAPDVKPGPRSMDCYIFHWRSEWEQYTMRFGGPDAKVFLQIRNGGYTLGDRYVAYYYGRLNTYSVAAHEGWHQFAGRNFKGRLPPFLEEGIACMFETIQWDDKLPRWNLSVNRDRVQQLRKAIERNSLIPLDKVCGMHAGDVVGEGAEKIDAFYAQAWAFARFLYESDNGRFRPALRKWIAETADGTVYDPTGAHRRAMAPWRPAAVRPMIEHYLGMNMPEVSRLYDAWLKRVAYEEFNSHWR